VLDLFGSGEESENIGLALRGCQRLLYVFTRRFIVYGDCLEL